MSLYNNSDNYEPIDRPTNQVLTISHEDDQECRITGFTTSLWKWLFFHCFSILFLGIPYLISTHHSKVKALRYKKCSLQEATIALLEDNHENHTWTTIETENAKLPVLGRVLLRCFYYKRTKIVWIPQEQQFGLFEALIPPLTVDDYLNNTEGLCDTDYIDLLQLYGPNKIQIEVQSYWKLFIEEVFNAFYVFQAFSVALWIFDHYYIYAGCVFILTWFSVITSLQQTRKQSEALHELVESSKCHEVTVIRRDLLLYPQIHEVDPEELVPGDLIVLPKASFTLPCDAVLLTGQCIVNESVLTGESVPVTKTALHSSNELYSPSDHKRHTLFSGTYMIQSRYYGGEQVLARVVRTGFDTTKGALVKSILYPAPVGLKFYKDSLKFVFVLFVVAACGTSYCLYLYVTRKASIREIVIRSLDIITIVVPPALPAAMTVGITYSQQRLRKLKIFCISPPRINVCGKIKLACFDKTGTLTHDGLDTHSVVPCVSSHFSEPITDSLPLDAKNKLAQSMATCHSLTVIDEKLAGDPLDISMFEFTNWVLEEPGDDENARYDMLAPTVVKPGLQNTGDPVEIGIIRQFAFSSSVQCMSVICRELGASCMMAFTKGAPEKVSGMCLRESLPEDFSARLTQYAAKGYRVIALAYKEMPTKFKWKEAQKVKRDLIECDLTFLGLLVMQNPLKDETTPVIKILQQANIRTVMITGDNILTAVSVARDCAMVRPEDQISILEAKNQEDPDSIPTLTLHNIGSTDDTDSVSINLDSGHFAIDGKTWAKLRTFYPDLLPSLIVRTTVFARFQPDQKTQLVTYLQSLDYVVSMVGDGANDCGALKAAHVGVSLSQAEASVAAPFTSSIPNISCIIHLMLEGRCALVTSFAVFKYMALYSLIQFITVLILYKHHSTVGDMQFLFIDLITTTTLAVTIGHQEPARKLGRKRPPGSLVSPANLIPIVLQVVTCGLIQASALFYLYQQPWFEPVPDNADEEVVECWENTVLFTVSCFQYIILALVYSKGRPYRQILITNFWFLISALALTIFGAFLLISPTKKLAEFFEILFLPRKAHEQIFFRYKLLLLPILHVVVAVFIEVGVADRNWLRKVLHFVTRKKGPKNRYKVLLEDNEFLQWIQRNDS